MAAELNERWGTDTWLPVLLDTDDDFERSVAGFTRYDVLIVNSLKDGLNLVAKEGPLVNQRDGVLCLSPEAGAYAELARSRARGAPVRRRADRQRAPPRAVDARRRTPRARHASPRARRDAHAPHLAGVGHRARALISVARSPSSAGQPRVGRRPARRRRRCRAAPPRNAHRSGSCARPRPTRPAGRARRTRPGRRRRHRRTPRPRHRVTSSAVTVPLSTGTGGRSSTDIRPRSGGSRS